MKGRYKAVSPVTDFNVSQRIRVQLIEDGHTELAVESITQPIRDLEEDLGHLQQRVKALENERVKWQTDSQVLRTIESSKEKTAGSWAIKAWITVGGLVLAAAGAVLERLIEKPH